MALTAKDIEHCVEIEITASIECSWCSAVLDVSVSDLSGDPTKDGCRLLAEAATAEGWDNHEDESQIGIACPDCHKPEAQTCEACGQTMPHEEECP